MTEKKTGIAAVIAIVMTIITALCTSGLVD